MKILEFELTRLWTKMCGELILSIHNKDPWWRCFSCGKHAVHVSEEVDAKWIVESMWHKEKRLDLKLDRWYALI